jgi:rsbT antagonist protein RsbS
VPRVPVVRVGDVLVATLGDDVDDETAMDLQESLAERVVATSAAGVLLDISALEIVDSFICKVLGDTANIARVLGARVAVVGMRPAVAITLVELGLPLPGIATALTVDHGLRALALDPDEGAARGDDGAGRR